MEYNAQLAGKGHIGALHAAPLRHIERPALQARKSDRTRQHDVRRFKECSSHHGIADFADTAVPISLS